MSFLSKLFGRGSAASEAEPDATASVDYKGFTIRAMPVKDQGQYQVSGVIEKTIDGTLRQQRFVRADKSPNLDEISGMTLQKGQLMVDQQGDGVFQ